MRTSTASEVAHWQALSFGDAESMMAWLRAIGFVEHATYRDEADPALVQHAEWLWHGPDGRIGGIMFGSSREDGAVHNVGGSAAYLVTDDPDDVVERALTAGASLDRPVVDQAYGGRGGSVTDPEGNHWSFGSYQPR